jgi:hypothetical protein
LQASFRTTEVSTCQLRIGKVCSSDVGFTEVCLTEVFSFEGLTSEIFSTEIFSPRFVSLQNLMSLHDVLASIWMLIQDFSTALAFG